MLRSLSTRQRQHSGLTVVEVLVMMVLLALALWIAILVWIRIRQEAQQTMFKDRLRHVGVGIGTFYDAHQRLPADGRPEPPRR